MGHFLEIAFTPHVKEAQEDMGSRRAYESRAADVSAGVDRLTDRETDFIQGRDSFYMATGSETGWPYIQHRGGAPGFVKVLDDTRIGFLDYRGNRQYVSVGNLRSNDRVSLFFMDYARKARLKMFGHARLASLEEAAELGLEVPDGYRAHAERAFVIDVVGYDWNCPQHITERYTLEELRVAAQPLYDRIAELEAQVKRLEADNSASTM